MWTSNYKKYMIFLLVVFLIGVIGGLLFVFMIGEENKEILLENINSWLGNASNIKINVIIPHLFILSFLFVLSFFIIGLPLFIFFLFYNGFSIGFIIASLGSIFQVKGVVYSLFYILITKGLFLVFLTMFLFFLVRIGEKVFLVLIKKVKNGGEKQILGLVTKALVVLGIIFLNDVFLYFWGGKLVNIFKFLII